MSGPFPSAWQSGLDGSRDDRRAERLSAEKHTPLPWKVGDRKPYVEIWGRMSFNSSPIIATMEHEPREANARLIVESVNAVPRLTEALTEAIAVFEGMNDDEINEELLPRLRAALR